MHVFLGGKQIPTELKKDEAELKDDVLYDDAERDGKFTVICKGVALSVLWAKESSSPKDLRWGCKFTQFEAKLYVLNFK